MKMDDWFIVLTNRHLDALISVVFCGQSEFDWQVTRYCLSFGVLQCKFFTWGATVLAWRLMC